MQLKQTRGGGGWGRKEEPWRAPAPSCPPPWACSPSAGQKPLCGCRPGWGSQASHPSAAPRGCLWRRMGTGSLQAAWPPASCLVPGVRASGSSPPEITDPHLSGHDRDPVPCWQRWQLALSPVKGHRLGDSQAGDRSFPAGCLGAAGAAVGLLRAGADARLSWCRHGCGSTGTCRSPAAACPPCARLRPSPPRLLRCRSSTASPSPASWTRRPRREFLHCPLAQADGSSALRLCGFL